MKSLTPTRDKIANNQPQDRRSDRTARAFGWTVIWIWECALAKQTEPCIRRIRDALNAARSAAPLRTEDPNVRY